VALRPNATTWPPWLWSLLIGILQGQPEIIGLLHPILNSHILDSSSSASLLTLSSISSSEPERDSKVSPPGGNREKWIRVQLWNYEYGTTGTTPWTRQFINQLLPPSKLQTLYELSDRPLLDANRSAEGRVAPSPETAADIIKRAMLKGAKGK
jgi:hypothetical protein